MPRDLTVRIRVDTSALREALHQLATTGASATQAMAAVRTRLPDHIRIEAPGIRIEAPTGDAGWLGLSSDAMAFDLRPDDCWRCDATVATDALGLCAGCRTALADAPASA